MIIDIGDHFARGRGRCARFAMPECSTRRWRVGLHAQRRLCLAAGLTGTVKWGHPCYTHSGRTIAIIGALRGGFRLGFFAAGLLSDPAGVLVRQGPNTRHSDMVRFTDPETVTAMAGTVAACLAQAFGALTRGRRTSDAIALRSARSAATRRARIARFRPRILAGKGATGR